MKRLRINSLTLQELTKELASPGLILEAGPFLIRLQIPFPDLIRPIRLLFGEMYCLKADASQPPILDYEISLRYANPLRRLIRPRVAIDLDGKQWVHPFPPDIALPMLCWAINSCTFTYPHQYLILHAGVLARAGKALILPGTSGAGKSTLTAGLMLSGWQLLSDEIALVDPDTGLIHPCPLPVSLKEQSIDLIQEFAPEHPLGPVVPGTSKGRVAHLPVPRQAVELSSQALEPGWMIFPNYHPDHENQLSPVTKAQALQRCGLESFNYDILGKEGFRIHQQLIRRCECLDLHHSDLSSAVACITQHCDHNSSSTMEATG